MRRAVLLFLSLLLLTLCACTGPGAPAPSPASAPTEAPAPAASPTEAPAPEAAPTPVPTPESVPTSGPEPTPVPADRTLSVSFDGEKLSFPACVFSGDLGGKGEAAFRLLLPPEEATAEYLHNAWTFRCPGDPEAAGLELSFVAGTDAETLLPGFMDGYLSFTEIEFSEARSLGRTRGSVGRVTASDGETLAEGWLLDTEGGVLAAVLVQKREGSGREAAILRAMLDSFEKQ